jgi:hypothetical protein
MYLLQTTKVRSDAFGTRELLFLTNKFFPDHEALSGSAACLLSLSWRIMQA